MAAAEANGGSPIAGMDEIRDLLTGLLGVDVVVVEHPFEELEPGRVLCTATYVRNGRGPGAALVADLALATRIAAALTMAPPDTVEPMLRKRALDGPMRDNLREIFNVAAGLFNRSGGPHHVLGPVLHGPCPFAPAVVRVLLAPAAARDLRIDVPGYGVGSLAVRVA